MIEDVGIGAAFTRSKDLFKQTWGENVVGQAGLGVLGIFVMFPAVVLIVHGRRAGHRWGSSCSAPSASRGWSWPRP